MKTYLLSKREAESMRKNDRILKASVLPDGYECLSWWLRDGGENAGEIGVVKYNGKIGSMEKTCGSCYIRPAVTLKRGALDELKQNDDGSFNLGMEQMSSNSSHAVSWILAGAKNRLLMKGKYNRNRFSSPKAGDMPYENSNACWSLYFWEQNSMLRFEEKERDLLMDAPEGRIDVVDGEYPVRISWLRNYFCEIGLMTPKGNPSEVLTRFRFTEMDRKMILHDFVKAVHLP